MSFAHTRSERRYYWPDLPAHYWYNGNPRLSGAREVAEWEGNRRFSLVLDRLRIKLAKAHGCEPGDIEHVCNFRDDEHALFLRGVLLMLLFKVGFGESLETKREAARRRFVVKETES